MLESKKNVIFIIVLSAFHEIEILSYTFMYKCFTLTNFYELFFKHFEMIFMYASLVQGVNRIELK